MPIDIPDLAQLSRLLDEALDLEADQVEAWLAALPPAHAHLLPRLREMLARHGTQAHEPFLAAGPHIEADPRHDAVARPGDVIGPYRVLREIGHGGMGTVWLAERVDGSLKRQVALKLPRLAWGAGLAERMARERDIGALLAHPNIARLYDAGVDEKGWPYLVLEYIDGQPIDAWCEAQGLDVRGRLRLFLQVCRAVSHAHGRLVVHRDLKPSNVMVTPDGQVHLLDFGIAKLLHEAVPGEQEPELTRDQGRVLTPHYASPEQMAGAPITVQSDVYSLGVLLYELLTGTFPIAPRRATPGAIEDAILEGDAPPASSRVQDKGVARALRGEVDAILGTAMKRDLAVRYPTADALAQDIERHLNGEPVLARPDSALYRLRKALWRHGLAFGAAGAVLVSVLAGSGVAVVQAQRADREAERARLVKDFVVEIFDTNGNADGTLMQMPAHELLERGAKMIDGRFAGQPLLQAELYGVVRQMFSNLANYTMAVDYGSRQFETLSAAGAPGPLLAQVEINLASDLVNLDRLQDAVVRYRHAVTLAGDDPALLVQAHAGLTLLIGYVGADDKTAQAEYDTVVEIMSRHSLPPMVRAEALVMRGRWEDDVMKAAPLFDEAIRIALATQGPLSRTAMNARTRLGSVYAHQGNKEAALRYYGPALAAMRTLGGPNDVRAALEEARLASVLYDSGSGPQGFAETRAMLESSLAALDAQSWPVPRNIVNEVNILYGSALSLWGDVTHGYALLAPNAQEYLASSPHSEWADSMVRPGLADAAARAGHTDVALAAARQELEFLRPLVSKPADLFPMYWLHAGILHDARRFKEAEAVLAEYAALPGGAEGLRTRWGPESWDGLAFPLFAILREEEGDMKGALEQTQGLDPARHTGAKWTFVWQIRAAALCATGHADEGLAVLQRLLSKGNQDTYDASPSLASMRANMGLCALAAGHPQLAREASALASAAIASQPEVAERWKEPVRELERKLRHR